MSLLERIHRIMGSDSVVVIPVGEAVAAERGIVYAGSREPGAWQRALIKGFGAVALAAALAAPVAVHAQGVGNSAGVYGQSQGQVMEQGRATRMTVIGVRPVEIEVAPPTNSNQTIKYAVTAGAGGLGAVAGAALGGNTQTGRQLGGILGGIIGAVGGAIASDMIDTASQPKRIAGTEIQMMDAATKNVVSVTQAGEQQFQINDPVLVITTGGKSRVVADQSRSPVTQTVTPPVKDVVPVVDQVSTVAETAKVIGTTAQMIGLEVNPRRVGNMLLTQSGPEQGSFVGTVVAVDAQRGLVFQNIGRGQGEVHLASVLSKLPTVGEKVTIKYQEGRGTVQTPSQSQTQSRGRG